MEPLQDSPQAGCWSPAGSPDTTQKDLHHVSQVAAAPELTLLPLLPDVQLPIPPVPQDSSAELSQPSHLWCSLRRHSGLPGFSDVPSADLLSTSTWVSLFLGAHAACYAHGLVHKGDLEGRRQHRAEGSCAGACATCADAPVEKQDGSAWEQAGPATAVVCGAMRMLPKSLSAGSSSKTLPHNIAGLDVACSKSSSAYTTRE